MDGLYWIGIWVLIVVAIVANFLGRRTDEKVVIVEEYEEASPPPNMGYRRLNQIIGGSSLFLFIWLWVALDDFTPGDGIQPMDISFLRWLSLFGPIFLASVGCIFLYKYDPRLTDHTRKRSFYQDAFPAIAAFPTAGSFCLIVTNLFVWLK